MKTKEFIENLEGIDYSVYDRGGVLEVVHNTKNDVSVVISKKDQFYLCSYGSNNKVDEHVLEICYEYAVTPIEYREEEKKYTLSLPMPYSDDYRYKTYLHKVDGETYIFNLEDELHPISTFTQEEIDGLPNQDFIKTLVKEEV